MSIILAISLGLLIAAAALVLVRVNLGPTNLDRALSLDVLIVIITGIIATQILRTDDVGALPIMVVFSLTGFVGSVSVARFMARKEDES
ncbi:monovalent cation/H+ antiporter complex subunit F [Janibacter limosus]|jgi:multicomponent Na+:H+ antiporter subunit F|uniref:Cation:proton antiporter n=1 Tax=Janibacter limosus TaxID=53458 RepID=A0A4P6MVV0_9MICO|nr:monovalent cation/H+ antiporter complex subunit F [Janibacter limosus]QBF47076.1 cation:proton antiporter [Janibacter limosus]